MKIDGIVLTCEHGGNRVPEAYAHLFRTRRARAALATHRGYDIGALRLTRALGRQLGVPVIHSTVTRLLVELNRSVGHRQSVSEFAAALTLSERDRLLRKYYFPYRSQVESAVREFVDGGGCTLHLSVHSFTSSLDGSVRSVDVGLLYDPNREGERILCARWKDALHEIDPKLRLRRNYPYLGKNDGLTTTFRRRFSPTQYIGLELEVNQGLLDGSSSTRRRVTETVADSFERLARGSGWTGPSSVRGASP